MIEKPLGVFMMADREKFEDSKRGTEKPQHDRTGTTGQSQGAQPAVKRGSVGREEPDLSKEHQTEIAVEAGRKGRKDHEGDAKP